MSKALLGLVTSVLLLSAACGDDKPKKKTAKKVEGQASEGFIGVHPSVFKCETLGSLGDIAKAVGGEVVMTAPMFEPPKGTPAPCDYRQLGTQTEVLDGAPAPAQRMWSVRFDCRDSYMPTTTKEMERLVADEGATRVNVGKWGVDHRNAALVFVDDDTPCSIRVVGPGATERLAIGNVISAKLTLKTAPMTPRPAPQPGGHP